MGKLDRMAREAADRVLGECTCWNKDRVAAAGHYDHDCGRLYIDADTCVAAIVKVAREHLVRFLTQQNVSQTRDGRWHASWPDDDLMTEDGWTGWSGNPGTKEEAIKLVLAGFAKDIAAAEKDE